MRSNGGFQRLRPGHGTGIVDFHQPDAGRAADALNNRGVGSGVEGRVERRFPRIRRRQARIGDGLRIRTLLPVVIRLQDGAVAVVELERRIGEGIGDPGRA